ncbi:MAG: DUF4867 family protein [Clostridia bacterium]|nr:DUF4867 family protein [Clostridia bacterium]
MSKIQIIEANAENFKNYGRIISEHDFSDLIGALSKLPVSEDGVVYEPSVESLEASSDYKYLTDVTYGELPIEIGYCGGHNTMLNALEYHRSSEVNVFATDAILLLGLQQDITSDFKYDTSKVVAFKFKKGTVAEVYATTLHYAPCGVDGNGFMVGVVLPKGTNYPLDCVHEAATNSNNDEDKLITAKNKWLICHPDAPSEAGHFPGLFGENIDISSL